MEAGKHGLLGMCRRVMKATSQKKAWFLEKDGTPMETHLIRVVEELHLPEIWSHSKCQF